MQDDEPIPCNIEWQKEVENMWWIENAGLEGRQERNTGIVVRVPKRKFT